MKVHQVTKPHAMQTLAETHATPVTAVEAGAIPHSDKLAGMLLANEAIALVKQQQPGWQSLAVRIIEATTEVRASFLNAVRDQVKAMKAENADTGINDKTIGQTIRTANQYVTNLQAIARAFNGGATIRGMVEWVQQQGGKRATLEGWRLIGWHQYTQYARTMLKGKGGRPADNLLVKYGKWLDAQRDKVTNDDEKAILADLDRLYAQEVKKHADLLPAAD